MKKTVLAACAALLGACISMAHAQDAVKVPAKIKQAGKLVVGTSPTYPPLEFKDPATLELKGLDIDLAEEIGKRLGVKVEWQEQSFDQLINSLDTGRINMGASGMTDIPARREKTDFVDYFATGSQLFTTADAGPDLKKAEDVCGKPVAVNRNGIFFIRLKEFNETVCKAKGLAEVKYVLVDKTADARLQLIQKRAVAAVQGVDAIRYLNEHEGSADKGKFILIDQPIAVDYAGFGFSKAETELRDAVAVVVDAMIADGTYSRIFAKWEMPYAEVKKTMINTQPRN
ncbi:ABC transporter substrate-binding protein [Chelatococcus asaccharovorans]|uniref:Amino acid ABC transporter substrate-binding protein (PAAT family) n=1 Tax=Chelatococcus asaccharovorans TaxID=28210 RepID=A0A2V3U5R6_9HYPH|nr:ABC transporter substrate-binding protein [Chelatococcus asaccharovorans]MBS7703680.1 ABC transporter substrate-binding protein [Chelatococcus asaccharovorans]PXW57838.1 amino acid ABC transporter substrate-binding protein (PAAT family) [Chelatococcus asaccharovorans]CAH1669046.1 Amino acid ABC transporter substrate-binding protein (PAAT family) [Chelatococcus asaccharovorans]CAH1679533.1 Amino acid ABC transporter substrate-binding protein (PAAT family) [Chelatococcus asaccharovorans]